MDILRSAELTAGQRAALEGLGTATLLAQGKGETIPKKLQELLDLASAQPANFHVEWGWDGTVHSIRWSPGASESLAAVLL